MAERKEFKAESKRLLDLMINSIYTHKEIFLRELISNASDALDKYYLKALENKQIPEPLKIRIDIDEPNRTLTISDNGIGMTKEELEENLGTIARSGSLAFKEELKKMKDAAEKADENLADKPLDTEADIIGQFGVGFYSAFMVADHILVVSKADGSDQAWAWESNGTDGYTIEPAEREGHGTTIILSLKANDEDENYSKYLETSTISALVRKYSDYIRYPIEMDVKTQKIVEETKDADTPEFEEVTETRTINSMVPLWKKPRNEVTDEQLDQFYKEHFFSYATPLDTEFFSVEGRTNFTALLYIPSRIPENFYSTAFKPGLQLYSRGVLIEDRCESLLPEYLRFLQGLVDSSDLSLNISREMLQHDRQLAFIRKQIERRVLRALADMQKNKPEDYADFWKNFGLTIKFGIYNRQSSFEDQLKDLLVYPNSISDGYLSLKEFVEKMPEDDKDIYYLSGKDPKALAKLPAAAKLKAKGYPVLYLTDEIDELLIQSMGKYEDHEFRNAAQGDLDLDTEEEKKEIARQNDENKPLLEFMKEALPDVSEVRLSTRLVDDPVMLVAGDGMSFEMERLFMDMARQAGEAVPTVPMASRILEINPNSPVWALLRADYVTDKEAVKKLASILYDQACLIQGFTIKDPVEYARTVVSLLAPSTDTNAASKEEEKPAESASAEKAEEPEAPRAPAAEKPADQTGEKAE